MIYISLLDGNRFEVRRDSSNELPANCIEIDEAQYDGLLSGSLTYENESVVPYVAPPEQVYVPAVVSMRQARLALLQAGYLGAINSAMTVAPEADRITWEYATEVSRSSALVGAMAAMLGLSDADLDNLFTVASTL